MKETKYDFHEIHRNRNMEPPMPWADIAESYEVPQSTIRGRYNRWLMTVEGQKASSGYITPAPAYVDASRVVIESREDNTYLFGVAGDRHIGSKYHRQDVVEDLYKRFTDAGVDAVLDTGNWIDGESRFNRQDLIRVGMTPQLKLMSQITPKIDVPTLAVWGDCHEGWYASREGIDIGEYAESVMKKAGHDWNNLGYLEAYITLRNKNTGSESIMALIHPGGGTAYALSYKPQKIVESLEGGEKPAVMVMGHYHKLEALNIRNVWVLQAGTCCDQTPFMRKKSIAAHVGGTILGMEQDPESGAIIGFSPDMKRYFNEAFYGGRWSKHGPVAQAKRVIIPQEK
jgi:predicted phosphodiesterase